MLTGVVVVLIIAIVIAVAIGVSVAQGRGGAKRSLRDNEDGLSETILGILFPSHDSVE